jgi:hypothetical protein
MYHVEHIGLPVLLDKFEPDAAKLPNVNEPLAVQHYINYEVPGTYRLISVNRIEYPGMNDPKNVVYQFVWSKPE